MHVRKVNRDKGLKYHLERDCEERKKQGWVEELDCSQGSGAKWTVFD